MRGRGNVREGEKLKEERVGWRIVALKAEVQIGYEEESKRSWKRKERKTERESRIKFVDVKWEMESKRLTWERNRR